MLAKGFADLRGLHSKLSGRDEDEALNFRYLRVDLFECGDDKCSGFASAVLCAGEDISTSECDRDAFFLNRRRLFVASFEYTHQQITVEFEVLKF